MGNNNTPSDQELIQQAIADPALYAEVFNRYYQPLLRYVTRLGCHGDDAQDVLQDTFLSAYLNLRDYDTSLKFSSWIYRIAHNKAISFFRKQNIRPKTVTTEEQLLLMELVADDTNISEEVDKKFLQEKVHGALDALKDKYRDPLILKFLEDKSYEEISDILHVPIGTVGTLINRAKKKLKEILEK
jgi:RNA polymerase sigma-70 factor (ECF subfamily)